MALTTIDDRGLKTPIDLLDNEKTRFGTGNDLEIYHDGTDSWIDSGTGDLKIRSQGDDLLLYATDNIYIMPQGNDNGITLIGNGAVELYYDSGKKFETKSDGAIVYGIEGGAANLFLYADEGDDDADKLRIQQSSSGDLWIENYASGSWEAHLKATGNGGVELYYDNSKKLHTNSVGVNVTGRLYVSSYIDCDSDYYVKDNKKVYFGNGSDLKIWHASDASVNKIESGTNTLYIGADHVQLTNGAITEAYLKGVANGAVELYYDNVKQFETIDGGVRVPDSKDIQAGDSGDLKLYHDGSNSYIRNLTGALYLRTGTGLNIQNSGGTETYLYTEENGAVFLRYDNATKLETSSTGVTIPDTLKITDTELSEASDNFTINIQSGNNDFYVKNGGTTIAAFKGSNKNLEITDGDLVIETAGHGINFHPHSGTDNLLDDYEEGTWSGSLIANSVPNTLYGTTTGHYTKIGREVKVSIKFDGVDVSGIASGNIIQIAGLPFTSINADDRDISSNFHTSNVGFDTSRTQKFMCAQNGTTFNGFETKDDSPGVVWYTNDWDSNNITMYFTGHYTT